jgi:hypothetical protein
MTNEAPKAEPKRPVQKCAYCGARNQSVSMHSGILECDKCWYYRKMDRPAALHWAEAAAKFLSNVDMYDWMHYLPSCQLSKEEMNSMLVGARRVEIHSRYLVRYGPKHRWDAETHKKYEEEMAKTRGVEKTES